MPGMRLGMVADAAVAGRVLKKTECGASFYAAALGLVYLRSGVRVSGLACGGG